MGQHRRRRTAGTGSPLGVRFGAVLLGALLLTACGTRAGVEPGQSSGSGPPAEASPPVVAGSAGVGGFPACEDVPQIRADDSLYRDEPVYGNATDLVQEVSDWASGQPGFVELGLDRERNGWITLWVTDADTDDLNAQIAQRWPGEGIVAVEVPYTSAELMALGGQVDTALREAGLRGGSSAALVHHGVASVFVGVLGPEVEEVLAPFAGRPLCVDGIPAEEAPVDRPQPTEGVGWRLLGEATTGEAYRTSVATTDDQLHSLWQSAGLEADPPAVDWDAEIAVWFGAAYGSGCPVRMDGVVVTDDLLHADLVVPGEIYGCHGDANPHAFVVAVSRDLLPQGPFLVQLESRDPFGGAPEERTMVDVDLSAAASTATDEQIHTDPDLLEPGPPPLVADGDDLHQDQAVRYVYRDDPSCETPVIGPLGGSVWRLADGEAPWDVTDGEELSLHPLGPEDDVLFASTQRMDWLFARLPEGSACP